MQKFDPSNLKWNMARKTQSIRAKPLINIMVDKSVFAKFMLDTLEGKEVLGDGTLVCLGAAGDVWQQMPKKLLAKYDVTNVDTDGWMVCDPKPDNAINVIEVTSSMRYDETGLRMGDDFYIIGQFGEQSVDGLRQYGTVGDFIGQNREDPTDIWIIRRKIFLNTYNLIH